jgi:acetyltransferase-like isoleucine patch superfamily enzyme
MPIDRRHAFASGKAYGRPGAVRRSIWTALGLDALLRRLADWQEDTLVREVWESFDRQARLADSVLLGPNAWCMNGGQPDDITIGANTVCRAVLRRDRLGEGRIVIHDDVYLGDDVLISCMNRVEIGPRVMVAHGAQIFDNDSHPITPDLRYKHWRRIRYGEKHPVSVAHAPVVVESDAWIGTNALIMKGVVIREGSIVAAGSVVTQDVPPCSLVAGNPARVIRTMQDT